MALKLFDAHLDLHGMDELPGRHGNGSYNLHELVVAHGRAFLSLSSMNNDDPLKNDYFAYEFGGSGVKETLLENGKLTKDQEASFKTNFYDGMKSQGLDEGRLMPIPDKNPETGEQMDPSTDDAFLATVEKMLEKDSTITQAAKLKHVHTPAIPGGMS